VGIRANRRVGARLSTHAGLTATRSDFRGIIRRDEVFDASVGLSYRLSRFVSLDGDYRLTQRHSDVPEAQYYRHEIYLGLRMDAGAAPIVTGAREEAMMDTSAAPGGLAGFYLGTSLGNGVLDTRVTAPLGEHGSYLSDFGGDGTAQTAFAGYGRSFGRMYLGIEADGSQSHATWHGGATIDSKEYTIKQRRSEGLALNIGYVLPDNGVVFASVGRRRARFDSSYLVDGNTVLQRDTRMGTSHGVGMDAPLSPHVFVRARYDVTRYDSYDINYTDVTDRLSGSQGQFQLGIGWRFGDAVTVSGNNVRAGGFYAGVQGGDDRSGSTLDAVNSQPGPPSVLTYQSDFGGRGNDLGAFVGYGHAFGPLYAGIEVEGDASRAAWYHQELPNGRKFSVEARGSHGAGLRLGYVARSGVLVYARAGRVRGQFHTAYVKGKNADTWVSRDDTRAGTRFGVGVEAPLSASMFVRLDYTTTRYTAVVFSTTQALVDNLHFVNRQQLFRIGLGLRF
jgi:opacity protein-like surface antigen